MAPKTTKPETESTPETIVESVEAALPTAQDIPTEDEGESGTVVPEEEIVSERTAVVFIGPYHRYSRGDTACFDSVVSRQLVEERKVAVWPKDSKKALVVRPGEFDHDTDVG